MDLVVVGFPGYYGAFERAFPFRTVHHFLEGTDSNKDRHG